MAGIEIPRDRSQRSQPRGYCMNPECREGDARRFEFNVQHGGFACPKCGNNQSPYVGMLTLTHMLLGDVTGPIVGMYGRRYRMACHAKRDYLATPSNDEAATGDKNCVNCQECLKVLEDLRVKENQGLKASPDFIASLVT